jgi:hypothetical protein
MRSAGRNHRDLRALAVARERAQIRSSSHPVDGDLVDRHEIAGILVDPSGARAA